MKQMVLISLFFQFMYFSIDAVELQKNTTRQILIKAGTYFVGANKEKDNKPLRQMYFDKFSIDMHPVTNRQYISFLQKSNYKPQGDFSILNAKKDMGFPATNLTYNDAEEYAKFYKKRLPTEWEWEIVSRSLDKNVEYVSNNLGQRNRGHFYSNRIHKKVSVLTYPPNQLGVYGMAGNVYEWTSSSYEKKFLYGEYINKYIIKVLRGGSWTNNSSDIRTTTRTPFPSNRSLNWIGFRCVSDR